MPDVGAPKNDIGYDNYVQEGYDDDVWLTADLNNSLATAKPASNIVYTVAGRLPEMNNSQEVAGGIGVANLSGAAWYDREWREVAKTHPDWTKEQVYGEMTRRIQEADWNALYQNVISDIAHSSSPAERDQKIERYRSKLLGFYVSGIDVDNDVEYLREVQGVEPQYRLSPTNTAFVDATLSFQDMANGYHLEYNENGVLWRVKASGEPHPDDLAKYLQQQEYKQSISENLDKNFSMGLGGSIIGKTSVAGGLIQTEGTLIQESSKARDSLFNGPLLTSARMSDVDPYFSGAETEYATDGSISDYISDKWREFETWRGKAEISTSIRNDNA